MATATGYGKKPTIGKRRISTGPRKSLIGTAVSMSKKDPAKAKALARASIGLGPTTTPARNRHLGGGKSNMSPATMQSLVGYRPNRPKLGVPSRSGTTRPKGRRLLRG